MTVENRPHSHYVRLVIACALSACVGGVVARPALADEVLPPETAEPNSSATGNDETLAPETFEATSPSVASVEDLPVEEADPASPSSASDELLAFDTAEATSPSAASVETLPLEAAEPTLRAAASDTTSTVRYHSNIAGAADSVYDQAVSFSSTQSSFTLLGIDDIASSNNAFATTLYEFSGWNTRADGSGDSYSKGATLTTSSGETQDLYAQWKTIPLSIKFSANGGIFTDDSIFKAEVTKQYFEITRDASGGEVATLKTDAKRSDKKPIYKILQDLSEKLRIDKILYASSIPDSYENVKAYIPNKPWMKRDWAYWRDEFEQRNYHWSLDPTQQPVTFYTKYSDPVTNDLTLYLVWKDTRAYVTDDIFRDKDYGAWTVVTKLTSTPQHGVTGASLRVGDTLSFTTTLNVRDPHDELMMYLYSGKSGTDNFLRISKLSSVVQVSYVLPKGIAVHDDLMVRIDTIAPQYQLKPFDDGKTYKLDGQTLTVQFELKNNYTNYEEYVADFPGDPRNIVFSVSGMSVSKDAQNNSSDQLEFTTKVDGHMDMNYETMYAGVRMVGSWHASHDNKRGLTHESSVVLPGDLLLSKDSQEDEALPVSDGEALSINATFDMSPLNELLDGKAGDYFYSLLLSSNTLMTAYLKLPEGVTLGDTYNVSATDLADVLEIGDVVYDADTRTLAIPFVLKKADDRERGALYEDLATFINDIASVGNKDKRISLTVSDIQLPKGQKAGTRHAFYLLLASDLLLETGDARANIYSESIKITSAQAAYGQDGEATKDERSSKTISLRVQTKGAEVPVVDEVDNAPTTAPEIKEAAAKVTVEKLTQKSVLPKTADISLLPQLLVLCASGVSIALSMLLQKRRKS